MTPLTASPLDLLDPWSELEPQPAPEVRELAAVELPPPYRELLAHRRDMTSTLEDFHREPVVLRVLAHERRLGALLRRVLLVGQGSGRPVELGAIRIELERFPPPARETILAGRQPLGGILAEFEIPYRSRPRAFFSIAADARIGHAPELPPSLAGTLLYGRRNALLDEAGHLLADVVEILPPLD